MKKKIGIIAFIIISIFAFADLKPSISISPISPVFQYEKGDLVKTITVKNTSDKILICTPTIKNNDTFVTEGYYLGPNLFVFPEQFQLAPGQSSSFKLYVYNVETLKGTKEFGADGEFDAIMSVETKNLNEAKQKQNFSGAQFILKQEGVVELFKGKLVQKLSLSNLKISKDLKNKYLVVSGKANNDSNVHMPYQIDYKVYDAQGKLLATNNYRNSAKRNTVQDFSFNVPKALTGVSAKLSVTMQDINTKKYGNAQAYEVK